MAALVGVAGGRAARGGRELEPCSRSPPSRSGARPRRSRFSPRTTASVAPLRELRPPRRPHTRPRLSHPVHLPPPSASPSPGKSRTQPHLAPSLHHTPELRPIASQYAVRKLARTAAHTAAPGAEEGALRLEGRDGQLVSRSGSSRETEGLAGGTSSAHAPPSRSGELTFALPLAAQSPCRTTR